MEFFVKLIDVQDTSCQDARDDLNANCTHVAKDFWLYEGDEFALHVGITFTIAGEQPIEGYGDLTGSQIKRMVCEAYNVDKCFIY